MDTILNLGLEDQTVAALDRKSSNPRFAYDCYRRFHPDVRNVVLEYRKARIFDQISKRVRKKWR